MGFYPEKIGLLLIHTKPGVSECVKGQGLEPALGHIHVNKVNIPAPFGHLPGRFYDLTGGPTI